VKSLVVSEIWRDGADEVRDKCHSLVDIQLIWLYMNSISVECALLCSECSNLVTTVTMLNLPKLTFFSARNIL
jgi:hypothetical protein